ncbi:MAG: hypothetical protein ABL986_19020 [Vicinamibacterales bacterium]
MKLDRNRLPVSMIARQMKATTVGRKGTKAGRQQREAFPESSKAANAHAKPLRGRYDLRMLVTMPSTKLVTLVMSGMLVVLSITGCGDARILEAGYFQDDRRNRIRTFELSAGVSAEEVHAHAKELQRTPGQLMAAYYYDVGNEAPKDRLTQTGSVLTANELLYDMPGGSTWRFAYVAGLGGAEQFVDCREKSDDDLCRQAGR